jgi:hypothetical protein
VGSWVCERIDSTSGEGHCAAATSAAGGGCTDGGG